MAEPVDLAAPGQVNRDSPGAPEKASPTITGNAGGAGASPTPKKIATGPTSKHDDKPDLPGYPPTTLKDRWQVVKKIGHGAFGDLYAGVDLKTGEAVAIKLERADSKRSVLRLEVAVLRKLQGSRYVGRFYAYSQTDVCNYMVMELLGENLSELRRRQVGAKFSLATALKLGTQMLRGVQAIHEHDFLHRDIKPSNYVMGTGRKRGRCFLIDFGLARRFRLANGELRPARDQAGFRGTARYASINSHECKELGRRDDLWSLLYVMVEFLVGYLPWRKLKDKEEIYEMKVKYNGPELVAKLPGEFLTFMEHIQSLEFDDKPDYDFLFNLMNGLYEKSGYHDNTPYDWQQNSQTLSANYSSMGSSLLPHRGEQPSMTGLEPAVMSTNMELATQDDQSHLPRSTVISPSTTPRRGPSAPPHRAGSLPAMALGQAARSGGSARSPSTLSVVTPDQRRGSSPAGLSPGMDHNNRAITPSGVQVDYNQEAGLRGSTGQVSPSQSLGARSSQAGHRDSENRAPENASPSASGKQQGDQHGPTQPQHPQQAREGQAQKEADENAAANKKGCGNCTIL